MLTTAHDLLRLAIAARVIARHNGFIEPEQLAELPACFRFALGFARMGRAPVRAEQGGLAEALSELGPSYIKLGQFLATRPDLIGEARAADLRTLQDRMAPFGMDEARAEIAAQFGMPAEALFESFGPPVAAASIAQVHRAEVREPDGRLRPVAVKILRPGIESRFAQDLRAFFTAARLAEGLHKPLRRLKPVAAVATLERSVAMEMDLRMEAAAMSEMATNGGRDQGFRVPEVDWQRTSRRVLTSEWIDGIPLSDRAALIDAGIDLELLGNRLIEVFLRHAMRDGFFHADMHPGNLFADAQGNLVAVDFGIMGRLTPKDRRFLAEILWGFITRDYARIAAVHFDAGYVPQTQDPAVFAQALRAIGEPILDRTAEDISMARLLTQLFEVTSQFDMQTQPQLLLLQKTMVVVEGVARSFNPRLNMWTVATPVVREWMNDALAPERRLAEVASGAAMIGRLAADLPEALADARRTARLLSEMAEGGGLHLDQATVEDLAKAQARHAAGGRIALWIGALALVVMALALLR
jgi:ubiquinone biosynthesis protein